MHLVKEEFFSKAKAVAFLQDYYRRFNKAQFGTRLMVRQQRLSQHWEVVGHRFA